MVHDTQEILNKTINFYFNEPINNKLPRFITVHEIDNKILIIAPDKPTWLVLSHFDYELFNYFRAGNTIKDALYYLMQQYHSKESDATKIIEELLIHIVEQDFLDSVYVQTSQILPNLRLHLTNKCNLTCQQCYMNSGQPLTSELTTQEWLSVVKEFSEIPKASKVTLLGGEPLLYPGFLQIARFSKAQGLDTLLITNGTQFKSYEHTQEIMQYIDNIKISIDGATEDMHDSIRGKGSFKAILRSLDYLKRLDRKININITVMKNNVLDLLENLPDFFIQLDNPQITFNLSIANKQGRALELDTILPLENVREVIKNLYDQLKIAGYKNISTIPSNMKVINCNFGGKATITADGYVYACHSKTQSYGNIRQEGIKNIFAKLVKLQEITNVENIEKCKNCDLKYICGGGCKVQNHLLHDDYTKVSCGNFFKELFYRRLVNSIIP